MDRTGKSLALVLALAVSGIAAACGSPPPAVTPEAPPATAQPQAAAPSSTPSAAPAPSGAPSAAAAVGPGNSTPISASKLVAEAKKIGIDFKKPLSQIPLKEKKQLMPLFKKALGYDDCTGCHAEGDFKQETRNMKIARGMWDHFVVALRDAKGGEVFCDSCHAAKAKNLDRTSRDSVRKFMETEYVGKLTRADKKDNECATCHADDMQLKIVEKLWGIAAK